MKSNIGTYRVVVYRSVTFSVLDIICFIIVKFCSPKTALFRRQACRQLQLYLDITDRTKVMKEDGQFVDSIELVYGAY